MADIAEKPKAEEQVAEVEVKVATKEATETKPAPAAGEGEAEGEVENGAANGDSSKLERSIIHQVEYYFGDANLMRDKFLQAETEKDDGWVPLATLITFKRLAALSTDANVIVDALLKSDEGLLEISDDHKKIRRHPERPLPESVDEHRKEIMTRTAYAKGFPLETTIAELVDYFNQFNKVQHVTMRKYLDKPTKAYKFKGSVFATFETMEQAKDFIEKEKVQFGERELLRKWQEKYMDEKQEERNKSKNKKKDKKQKKEEEEKIELPVGSVIFFDGIGADITREILREAFEKVDGELEIAYIDFSKGEKKGYVRLQGENNAKKFLEKLTDNKLKLLDDVEIVLRMLTADEEKEYLVKAAEQMRNRRNNFNKHHKKGGHHHHHHGHNKRRRGNDSNIPEKRAKNDG